MAKPTPLTIGIPYRDEGQSFSLLAGGLMYAIQELPPDVPRELIFCVNGSRAGFAEDLERLLGEAGLDQHNARVITSSEGKLAAQRAIEQKRALKGYVAFVDSDVVLEKNVLRLLWDALESDEHCMIAYGQPVPVFPEKLNILHQIMRAHYALRERAYHRAYFHGRAFMLREWFFDNPDAPARVTAAVSNRLRLDRGPLVDDIAMSRMAVARWGEYAIREVQEANVYFDPPDDLHGLYAGALRVALEIHRLDILYPQHAHLQKNLFRNSKKKHGLKRFSWRIRSMHSAHLALDTVIKVAAQIHVHLVRHGFLKIDALWIRVPGTKSFARHRLSWKRFRVGSSKRPRTPASSGQKPD